MPRIDVEQIFHEAREMEPAQREGYLKGACGTDVALRGKVEMLLSADAEAGSFMKSVEAHANGGATIEDPTGERPGEQIGRYKLLQQIGEGGFGSVWMAEQREPVKRRIALKIIKLGMDTKQVIARFEAERQALAMMDHPNIAKVLDAGATEMGRPFFVMELVKGVPILEYCDNEKLDTKARLDLFIRVCQAIQHAHQKGIIHRDIKPSNVMITLHDGVPVPKVIDFGIAKATNQELTEKTLFTQHRQMIGTPAYMSPEQAEMSGLDVDTRADIYSLGVLLYEILTGTTPFTNEELMQSGFAEMMRIIRETEPHKPSTRMSSLGEIASRTAEQRHVADPKKLGLILRGDLDWIVMKCLEKDRSRRYDTANGLAADILRHLGNEPVLASPPSAGYKLGKFMKRNRGQVVAGGVIAVALVVGMAGTTGGMLWAMSEKDRADTAATNATLSATAEKEAKLRAQANEKKAVDEAERAERELARATEVKRLITEMFSGVNPHNAQGADITLLKGILDETAERLTKGEVEDELIAAELHDTIGEVYLSLGLYAEAEEHLQVAVETLTRVLGDEHPDTLWSANNLGNLYYSQGRYAEAESLFVEMLEIMRRDLGDEHPDTLGPANNLAMAYSSQDRYAEAEAMYVETLRLMRRVLGEEDPWTLNCMHNLASLYQKQGRYAEAETLILETLEIRKRVQGEEHPYTLNGMNLLANLYRKQGRYAEAEPLYLQELELIRRVLGEEHPSTLRSMQSLAKLYQDQGRYAAAEPLYLETVEIMKRVLGEEHPSTANSMQLLASLYRNQDRYAEAEPLYLETLEIRKRVLGAEHPDTLDSMSKLANLYKAQGRYVEAEPLYVEASKTAKRVLGDEHPSTLGYTTNLGMLYNSMGRYEDAAKMLETSLPIKRRVLDMQHEWTWKAMRGLATAYDHLDRHDEALPLWRELLKRRLAAADDPDADADAFNEAAWGLVTFDVEELRDPEQALAYAQRACAMEEAAGGEKLWTYLDTLALAQHKSGDTESAFQTQKRAISLMPNPDADPETNERLAEYEAALNSSDVTADPAATAKTPPGGGG